MDAKLKRAAYKAEQQAERKLKLSEVFNTMDLDSRGVLQAKDLLQLGKARRSLGQKSGEWNEEKHNRLLKKMDVSGDGLVVRDEFVDSFEAAMPQSTSGFEQSVKDFMAVARGCRQRAEYEVEKQRKADLQGVDAAKESSDHLDRINADQMKQLADEEDRRIRAIHAQTLAEQEELQSAETAQKDTQALGYDDVERHFRDREVEVTRQRLEALGEVFDVFDLDNEGKIEAKELLELGKARRRLGQKSGEWTEEMNNRLVTKMDINGDGLVDRDEFVDFFNKGLPYKSSKFETTVAEFLEVAQACRAAKIKALAEKETQQRLEAARRDLAKKSALTQADRDAAILRRVKDAERLEHQKKRAAGEQAGEAKRMQREKELAEQAARDKDSAEAAEQQRKLLQEVEELRQFEAKQQLLAEKSEADKLEAAQQEAARQRKEQVEKQEAEAARKRLQLLKEAELHDAAEQHRRELENDVWRHSAEYQALLDEAERRRRDHASFVIQHW